MSEVWTVRKAILWTASYLEKKGSDAPRTDADLLLADALGVDRLRLLLDFDKPLSPEELAAYRKRIERRAKGEPLAYILGGKEFYGRDFFVSEKVLVPRPETEGLVDFGLEALPEDRPARVLDLCAGSGCIGISLALERPQVSVDLVELDPGAAEVASRNVEAHGVGDRVRVLVGDLFDAAEGVYDVILSNPPYVPSGEIPGLAPEVRREPRLALDGGPDGLDVVRRIARDAAARLRPGGMLALELALEQPAPVAELLGRSGFARAEIRRDFTHRDRYVVAWT
jgi:release factor glutamine methyltransferase